jgi:DNA replication protein DnaC
MLIVRNGVEEPLYRECQQCRQKKREAEAKAEALKELEEARENQRDHWFEECNIPTLFVDKTFENFERKLQPKAVDVLKGYLGKSIVLLSPDIYGVGKTHLVAALANHILNSEEPAYFRHNSLRIVRRSCPVYFITEAQLLARIRATYRRHESDIEGETEESIYRKLEGYDLLILDDVGKIHPRDFSFLQGVYYQVLDSRYVNEQPVILTTNLGYNELEAHIGGASADRLREMCGDNFVVMRGKSYRQIKDR